MKKSIKSFMWFMVPVLIIGCGKSNGSESFTEALANAMLVTVNGSLCASNSYPNKPCVGVTICTPGTSDCQAIDDIILDTGSTGLRIFKDVLSVQLTQATTASGDLAECLQFADNTNEWGPIEYADVVLGKEPAVTIPIQVIDASFGTVPSLCGKPDKSSSDAGLKECWVWRLILKTAAWIAN